ncbi:hypothetical protein QH494_24275 [Sphingomonas sp. AR_OL41]|nr:hypothetical protein [Sphingomonas sp. AR_OL41]MDH7975315.1 hypothetical protein [Sphingomonas sp. AR_OL41]
MRKPLASIASLMLVLTLWSGFQAPAAYAAEIGGYTTVVEGTPPGHSAGDADEVSGDSDNPTGRDTRHRAARADVVGGRSQYLNARLAPTEPRLTVSRAGTAGPGQFRQSLAGAESDFRYSATGNPPRPQFSRSTSSKTTNVASGGFLRIFQRMSVTPS